MMRGILFFLLLVLALTNTGRSQTYTWAITDTAFASSRGSGVCIDKNENLIIAVLNSPGFSILKYDKTHHLLWRKDMQGYTVTLPCVTTDLEGGIYLAGSGSGTVTVNSVGYYTSGMFLIKFDPSGAFQWFKGVSGDESNARAVCTDQSGNVYVGGGFKGQNHFDTAFVNGIPVWYSYIAKYGPNGTIKWIKYASQSHSSPNGMVSDGNGTCYIAGEFLQQITFDAIPLSDVGYPNGGGDGYLAKIDSSGNWKWATNIGGIDQDMVLGIAIDKKGFPYVSGFIGSYSAQFGNHTVNNILPDDFFFAKYDSAGNNIWATVGGGAGNQEGYDICADVNGYIYQGTSTKYINRFDSSGNYIWWEHHSASNDAMISDDSGGVYISGFFNDSVSFGSYHLTSKNSSQRMYVAKLYAQPLTSSIASHTFNESFLVYPNPSNHLVTLKFTSTSQTPIILNIKNSLGQSVYSETLKEFFGSFTKQIDLSFLSKGIYFIELVQENKSSSKKIILH